jgi:hypothetical protein
MDWDVEKMDWSLSGKMDVIGGCSRRRMMN